MTHVGAVHWKRSEIVVQIVVVDGDIEKTNSYTRDFYISVEEV